MWHNTIQCDTTQYDATQDNTTRHNTIQYNTIQYNTVRCDRIQFNKIQYDLTERIEAAVDNIATQKQSIADTSLLYSVNHEIRYCEYRRYLPCIYYFSLWKYNESVWYFHDSEVETRCSFHTSYSWFVLCLSFWYQFPW